MSRQREELLTLEKQFQSPLHGIEDRYIESGTDVDELLYSLESKLNNSNDDWNVRYDSLLEAMEYLKGGIAQQPDCDFSRLASGISDCVGDLRSSLVKRGSLLIAASAEIFKKDYLSSIDIIVPTLFKQLSHGTAVISNSAHYALLAIVRNVQCRRTSRLFLSKSSTKSNIQRLVIAESIKIMREEWPSQVIDGIDNELMNTLKNYSEDASPEVRQVAKQAIAIVPTPTKKSLLKSPRTISTPTEFNEKKIVRRKSQTPQIPVRTKTPVRQRKMRNSIIDQDVNENSEFNCNNMKTSNIKNTRSKSVRRVLFGPPKEKVNPDPIEEISEYMPPRTKTEARSFLQILKNIIVSKDFDSLFGLEELLAPSIISATNVMPQSELYIEILPPLFEKYTNEFSVQVHDLLIALNFNPILLAESINAYGEQQIAESFVGRRESEENESLQFFITFFNHEYELNITPNIRHFLLMLIQKYKNHPSIDVIENAIKVPETDNNFTKIVNELINKIKSLKKWIPLYQQLVIQLSSSTVQPEMLDIIEEQIISQFTDILQQGTSDQHEIIKSFLITGSMNCRGISFSKLAEPLLPILMNENKAEREKTEECFLILMNDPKTIPILISILKENENEDKSHAILSLILLYVTKSTLRQISSILPNVVDVLSSLIKSEVVGIRRISIMILVEFKCKVPKEFMPYFKKLTISHQKLINLYSNKRGQ